MIKNVGKSIEVQEQERKDFEAQIKAFDAETKRISIVQASMSPEQIQDIVMGTLHAAMDTGDVVSGGMPNREQSEMMPEQAEYAPQQGMPQEMPQEMPQGMPLQEMPPQGMPQ
jgi:hypothetical protein